MNLSKRLMYTARVVLASAALFAVVTACVGAETPEVQPGMSRERVLHILGEPSRRAVLDGKVLRDVADLPAGTDLTPYRFVYVYEETGLQVWFHDDKVTGLTRGGVSVR
jgi:hypothetical protein